MTFTTMLILNVVLDVVILGGLAFVMSRAARLTPHRPSLSTPGQLTNVSDGSARIATSVPPRYCASRPTDPVPCHARSAPRPKLMAAAGRATACSWSVGARRAGALRFLDYLDPVAVELLDGLQLTWVDPARGRKGARPAARPTDAAAKTHGPVSRADRGAGAESYLARSNRATSPPIFRDDAIWAAARVALADAVTPDFECDFVRDDMGRAKAYSSELTASGPHGWTGSRPWRQTHAVIEDVIWMRPRSGTSGLTRDRAARRARSAKSKLWGLRCGRAVMSRLPASEFYSESHGG